MCVQLLLGYLPPDQRQWQATLQSKRVEYARFCKVREPVFGGTLPFTIAFKVT